MVVAATGVTLSLTISAITSNSFKSRLEVFNLMILIVSFREQKEGIEFNQKQYEDIDNY